ncbi:hypothetical protein [Erythrobacter sp. EC-HK427]|uniref:hypothetical protein n=1 Tax=Erythrobacter sp. EC-HK427 TaxID=2038396 RepID=UPI0012581737|nr:hypothetical protein [Erythrobacter sp. EC-HK427]VVT20135.1 conserved exported hypothetical protein [Erythrobacter sp. EC-HK427]
MNFKVATAIAIASVSLSGCATVLNGVNMPVEFVSEPEGAGVEILDGRTCTAPCTFEMRRGNDTMVTFTAAGYEPVTIYMQSRTGGSAAGNLIAGGIIGGVVDASNGASNFLAPRPVYIRMARAGSGEPALLLDEEGEVISTVSEFNAEVAEDVREGLVGQGLYATVEDVPPAD